MRREVYKLIKLSSGSVVDLTTSEPHIVVLVLRGMVCETCEAEALAECQEGVSDEDIIHELLATACGAELLFNIDYIEDGGCVEVSEEQLAEIDAIGLNQEALTVARQRVEGIKTYG